MKYTDQEKARAIKLSALLDGLGVDLKQADSLDIISRLEGYSDQKADSKNICAKQQIAERFLSEMLDAVSELDYEKFTRHMDQKVLEEFTKKHFLRAMRNLHDDLGLYVCRKYLGSVKGGHYSLPVDKYPGNVRHIWRGVYRNHEVFINVGIYIKNGKPCVSGMHFR
jgi:hypothetical protein